MTRLQQTRRLANAYRKLDKAEDAYRAAQREFDDAYQPWAVGLVTNRDEARLTLVSTGHLEKRMGSR